MTMDKYTEAYMARAAGDLAKAEKALNEIIEKATEQAPKARMALAQLMLDGNRHTEAEELLREATERLLSKERKCEIAGIYLQLADAAAHPKGDEHGLEKKADFNKALRLYTYLVGMDLPRDLRERVLFERGQTALEAKNYNDAHNYFTAYLKEFDPHYMRDILGRLPGSVKLHEPGCSIIEARLGVIKSALLLANALPDTKVLPEFGADASQVNDLVVTLLENLLNLLEAGELKEQKLNEKEAPPLERARYYRPLVAGIGMEFSPSGSGAYGPTAARRAVSYALEFIEAYPNRLETLEMRRLVPQALGMSGFHDEALEAIQQLLDSNHLEFKKKEHRERLMRIQGRAKFFLGVALYGVGDYEEALECWQDYLATYPDGSDWGNAQDGVYRALGATGLKAFAEKKYDECRSIWAKVATKRGLADEAGWLHLAIAYTYLSEAKIAHKEEKQQKATGLFRKALDELGTVAQRYPGEVGQQARYRRGQILRFHLDDLAGAVREYKLANYYEANNSLSELTAVELVLESPKVFRTNEEAHVVVKSRNVEKLKVRRYPINIEDFFKKYHTSENVSRLDLDLVSPDKTWDQEIPNYDKYRDIEYKMPIGIEKPGAYAITVEGKDFEATVLVLQSDIDVIIATTHKEGLALVKNSVDETTVKGATVTIWSGEGSGQTLEMETGADGVARGDFRDSPSSSPYVFARYKDHVAIVGGTLPSKATVSLRDKGYIYASRPVFLPGEEVPVKGVIRICDDEGFYAVEEGQSHTVSLIAPDGRKVEEQELCLSRFGTFATFFKLPAQCALGQYNIQVVSTKKGNYPTYSGSFQVQHVQPAKLFLELTPSKLAALAGDKVEINVKAAYYTGAPLSSRAVQLRLPDGREVTLTTDKEGQVVYELDTTPFFRHAALYLYATLPGEDVTANLTLPILPAALKMDVRIPPIKFVVGQKLDVPLTLKKPDDEPLADYKVSAALFVARAAAGLDIPSNICERAGLDLSKWQTADETKVVEEELKTDERGRAIFSTTLEDAGSTRLVFTASDSEGRELTISRNIEVEKPASPDLVIDVERATLQVGDECKVSLRSKDAEGLGLLLFTSSSIFAYEVHKFKKGVTSTSFEITSQHAPNVSLIALGTGKKRLHRADQLLEVKRKLKLTLKLPDRPLLPGEEVEATVVARDGLDKPVETEFSLSMVDKGLLAKYPDTLMNIASFFEEGTRREVYVTACASVTFFRRGAKKEISKEVLQEAQRLREEAKEMKKSKKRKRALRAMAPPPPAPCAAAPKMLQASLGALGKADLCDGLFGGMPEECEESDDEFMFAECEIASEEPMPCMDSDDDGPAAPAEREELTIGAFWVGSVVTDKDGNGKVTITVPERTSSYEVIVKGVTVDTLVGEADGEAIVRRELYADVKIPNFLLEGDELTPVLYVHNAGSYKGKVELDVQVGTAALKKALPTSVDVPSRGVFPAISGNFKVPPADEIEISVQAKIGDKTVDRLVKRAKVRPWGVEERDGRAGRIDDSASFTLELPEGVRQETVQLKLDLSLAADDAVLALAERSGVWDIGLTTLAARAMALCVVVSGLQNNDERSHRMRAQARAAISSLISAQNHDGSWPFVTARDRRSMGGDISTTAWALCALLRAIEAGLLVHTTPKDKAISWLQSNVSSHEKLPEQEALLALSMAGAVDFSPLNRLNRNYKELSFEGQALLGLSFAAMDKESYAKALADHLKASDEKLSFYARSLSLLLFEEVEGMSRTKSEFAEKVQTELQRSWIYGAHRWLAVASLANRTKCATGDKASFEVEALVNGKSLGTLHIPNDERAHFSLMGEEMTLPVKVELKYKGRGECAYRAQLSGFTDKIEKRRELTYSVYSESYYHSPKLYKGRRLGDSSMKVERLAYDDFVEDYLQFSSYSSGMNAGRYVVVNRSIPAGLTVDNTSLPSNALVARHEAGHLTMVFDGHPSNFRLRLLPFCPGKYRALPAEIAPADKPQLADRLEDERELTVLEPGKIDDTAYDWTQREHIDHGYAFFQDGDFDKALEHLSHLPKDERHKWQNVVRSLLWIYCRPEYYKPEEIVDLFEIVEQRYSSIVIPYEKLLAVGRAYHDRGEDEAACLLWRSTLSSSFRDDLPVAAELEQSGEYMRSVSYLRDLYWQYPDLPTVIESLYGLSQDVYAHKEQAHEIDNDLSPNDLIARAVELLHEFLTYHADQPYADEATFSLLNAYRDLGMHEDCLNKAGEAAQRYSEGDYVDRFRYIRALAAFHLDKYDEAIEAARAVADSYSDDSNYARFILGQMYQALGKAKEALEAYREVRSEFADAEMSIDYLERRFLRMPEVVVGVPGEAISVELSYCNATTVEVLAYRVDLMRLFLKEKNLDRIAGVKLAGITPTCTFERKLPEVPTGTTGKATIDLPFEKMGAYLVLVRANEAFASGLALITPLTMEVQELQGAARATVLQGKEKKPANNVFSKCSDGYNFTSGKTDLRGAVTLAAESGERITIVARRGKDEYAFFRSKAETTSDDKPYVDAFEQISYDQGIRQANEMVQQRVSQSLRAKFSRRSKSEQGLSADMIMK